MLKSASPRIKNGSVATLSRAIQSRSHTDTINIMRRRSPYQRTAKWCALLGCCVLLLMWWLTSGTYLSYTHRAFGAIGCDGVLYVWLGDRRAAGGEGFVVGSSANVLIQKWPRITRDTLGCVIACIQVWWLLPSMAIVAGLLWWRDRSFPSGHCEKCGYDLTGNVSGVCSECGTEIESGAHSGHGEEERCDAP